MDLRAGKPSRRVKPAIGRPPRRKLDILSALVKWVKDQPSGAKLPSLEALRIAYGVNRKVIQAALVELEELRLVIRHPFGRAVVSRDVRQAVGPYSRKVVGLSCYSPFWPVDPYTARLVAGIIRELSSTGVKLIFSTRNWRWQGGDSCRRVLDQLLSSDMAGLLVLGQQRAGVLEALQDAPVPVVAVDIDARALGFDSVCFDNAGAGAFLSKRLAKLGHRRIAAIFEDPNRRREDQDPAWAERRDGFLTGLSRQGLPKVTEIHLGDRGAFEGVLSDLAQKLKGPASERPTALLLPCDLLEPISEITRQVKVAVPRDLTLVAFDAFPGNPKLTGILLDPEKLGRWGAFQLLRKFNDPHWRRRGAILRKLKGHYRAGGTHARVAGMGPEVQS